MLLGDLNDQISDPVLNDFCNVYNLFSLVIPYNPLCKDLFLTNYLRSFQKTVTIETSILDFHKMVITVMKAFYKNQKPRIVQFSIYKNFDNQLFQRQLNIKN